MVFNLYLSDEITNSHIQTNKYKIFQYSIKKNDECCIKKSFDVVFKKIITKKHLEKL